MKKTLRKKDIEKIAEKRIDQLFEFAELIFTDKKFQNLTESDKQKYANNYVDIARKISMKAQKPLISKYKKYFCKHCYSYIRPGISTRVRTKSDNLVTYCNNCKKFMKIDIKKKNSNLGGKNIENKKQNKKEKGENKND